MAKTEAFIMQIGLVHEEVRAARGESAENHRVVSLALAAHEQTLAVLAETVARMERVNAKMILWLVVAVIASSLGSKSLEILSHIH